MASPERSWSDEQIDTILGNLLRGGVLLASAVVLLGGVLWLLRHGGEPVDYHTFHGPTELSTLSGTFEQLDRGQRAALIQVGLLLLIATPVARVVFSVIAFVVQRDWTYIVVTLLVLGVLLFSLCSDQ